MDPSHRREHHTAVAAQAPCHHYPHSRVTTQGGERPAWDDSSLCMASHPGPGADAFQLCNEEAGHDGDHRALAEIAFNYRRYAVWTADGTLLPDVTTVPHSHANTDTFDPTCQRCREGWQAAYDQAQCEYMEAEFRTGQTPPSDGDQMT